MNMDFVSSLFVVSAWALVLLVIWFVAYGMCFIVKEAVRDHKLRKIIEQAERDGHVVLMGKRLHGRQKRRTLWRWKPTTNA